MCNMPKTDVIPGAIQWLSAGQMPTVNSSVAVLTVRDDKGVAVATNVILLTAPKYVAPPMHASNVMGRIHACTQRCAREHCSQCLFSFVVSLSANIT